jgi:hypothetical protein
MEERRPFARPVAMKLAFLVALFLLALAGALADAVQGRRPVLLTAPA